VTVSSAMAGSIYQRCEQGGAGVESQAEGNEGEEVEHTALSKPKMIMKMRMDGRFHWRTP
jgi:hypothetical protein